MRDKRLRAGSLPSGATGRRLGRCRRCEHAADGVCEPLGERVDMLAYMPAMECPADPPQWLPVEVSLATRAKARTRQAASLAKSTARHAASGCHNVDDETRRARLAICDACEKLDGRRCGRLVEIANGKTCGCNVDRKAKWATSKCPLNKWLATPAKPDPTNDV